MGIFVKVIILQAIAVVIVVYVLKRLLDKELRSTTLEQAIGFQPSEEARRTEKISVIAAGQLSAEFRAQLAAAFREKCPRAEVEFLENPALRGGLVVEIAGEVWDHSLTTRLKYLTG
jgi:F0F1-type ATP synthase delta subunit